MTYSRTRSDMQELTSIPGPAARLLCKEANVLSDKTDLKSFVLL